MIIKEYIKHIVEDFNFNDVKQQSMNTKDVAEASLYLVDLGLPSETLWCKYNVGVNPKQLSNPDDWYGNFYAWGETEPNKEKYDFQFSDYTFGNVPFTKYNKKDNLTQLELKDDAAYLSNNFLRTPTKEQLDELTTHCDVHPIKNYNNVIGLNGKIFVSKINGNHIFIPFAGVYKDSSLCNQEYHGGIWSSTVNPTRDYFLAYYMFIDGYYHTLVTDCPRSVGANIRPVYNK